MVDSGWRCGVWRGRGGLDCVGFGRGAFGGTEEVVLPEDHDGAHRERAQLPRREPLHLLSEESQLAKIKKDAW